jgi:hypothetical protein
MNAFLDNKFERSRACDRKVSTTQTYVSKLMSVKDIPPCLDCPICVLLLVVFYWIVRLDDITDCFARKFEIFLFQSDRRTLELFLYYFVIANKLNKIATRLSMRENCTMIH